MMLRKNLYRWLILFIPFAVSVMAQASGQSPPVPAPAPTPRIIDQITEKNVLLPGVFSTSKFQRDHNGAHLFLEPLAERAGSFIGVVMSAPFRLVYKDTAATAIYLIDPLEDGRYVMTPFGVGPSSLSILNDNPTHTLTISNSRLQMDVIAASNSNPQSAATFQHDSPLRMVNPRRTTFSQHRFNSGNGVVDFRRALFQSDKIAPQSGRFGISPWRTKIHLLKGRTVTAYGEEADICPRAFTFFLGYQDDEWLVVSDDLANRREHHLVGVAHIFPGCDAVVDDICQRKKHEK